VEFDDRGDASAANALVSARSIIDVLPRAVVVSSVNGRILLWNRRAEQLLGWSEAEVVGRSVTDFMVIVDDGVVGGEIVAAAAAGVEWRGDVTVLRRDGQPMRVLVSNEPMLDARGEVLAIIATAEDVTAQRIEEQHAIDLAEHLELALHAGGLGTWRWDRRTGHTLWDTRLEALYGLEAGAFDGTFDAYVNLLHPDDRASVLETVQRAIEEKGRYTVQHRVVWSDGSTHWVQGRGQVTLDEAGEVTGTMGCVSDVTATANELLSAQRLAFLGRINDALAASPTRADVMRNVTRAAVPTLGDWCAIHVLPEGGTVPDVEIAHADPTQVEFVKEMHERLMPFDRDALTGVPQVVRTGEGQFYPRIDEQLLAGAGDEVREMVRVLGLRSAIAVPLVKAGRIVGALQFVNGAESREYTHDDYALARAVASRIASTLENRRLLEQQREIASTLQASLLPDHLPAIPGLDLAVRYWAAGELTTVGGDFYDVFDVDDHYVAVIGDVCGTGPLAASLTGLARHTIRAAAWNGAAPADVLRQLNQAIRRSGRRTFCTALFCTLDRDEHGFRMTVTAGGHPLPVVRRADGSRETVGVAGTLLGLFDDASSTTVEVALQPGDAVLLYTDGVTDVRPPHDLTPDDVATMFADAARAGGADATATRMGELIGERLSFEKRDDDIALVVLEVR
jgi:PAS domain S-box-containing protein